MTETSRVSTQTRVDDSIDRRVSTVGRVHLHLEVQVINPETGVTVPRGTVDELCTRGYSVKLGHWQEPEKSAERSKTPSAPHRRRCAPSRSPRSRRWPLQPDRV